MFENETNLFIYKLNTVYTKCSVTFATFKSPFSDGFSEVIEYG